MAEASEVQGAQAARGASPEMLSVRDAARRLRVHENTVRNWAKRGVIVPVHSPGSRHQRFYTDEVLEVAREQQRAEIRSRQTHSMAELVDAEYLNAWANTRQAEELVPQLVRSLIAAEPGVIGLAMRGGDGIRVAEWDGLVEDAKGGPWVPLGPSAWEIGTGADPERKADEDYKVRTHEPLGVDTSVTTFVFVTARRWPGARSWERRRRAERIWRGVRVVDADDLAGWLQRHPVVHIWFSEQLGLRPTGVATAAAWLARFSAKAIPSLPSHFLLAARDGAVERVRSVASAELASTICVRAPTREEATAFVAAALVTAPGPIPALVGLTEEGWHRLCLVPRPSVLVAGAEACDVGLASGTGHRVIVPVGPHDVSAGLETVDVGPLGREGARKLLMDAASFSFETADRLAGLACRSLAAFLRDPDIAATPANAPEWSRGERRRLLGCLVLAGSWCSTEADEAVVAEIAGQPWAIVEDVLTASLAGGDPPVVQLAGGWQIASPDGSWGLLRGVLQGSDLKRFCLCALNVLSHEDPRVHLHGQERMLAALRGVSPRFSTKLRDGLTQGLALLAAFDTTLSDGTATQDLAAHAVRTLLGKANEDASAGLWASLSSQLRLIAEAAPQEFLDAVDEGLEGDDPLLRKMFAEEAEPFLASSSPHTGLLWALELLCWAPAYLSAAAGALARLAELDPGGRLTNRPMASLRTVFLPWAPRTSASLESRLRVLDRLRQKAPRVAWDLELAILPHALDTTFNTPLPRFRRWGTNDQHVPMQEWLTAVAETVTRALADAGQDPARWASLAERLGDLPSEQRTLIVQGTEKVASNLLGHPGGRQLWASLSELTTRHRRFPNARWALDGNTLQRLEEVARRLQPDDIVARSAWLFDWHPSLPHTDADDEATYQSALWKARRQAIQDVLPSQGLSGIERLASASKVPEEVGRHVAEIRGDADWPEIAAFLERGNEVARFAAGWLIRSADGATADWWCRFREDLANRSPDLQVAALLALGVPTRDVATLASGLSPDVQERYWRSVRPGALPDDARDDVVQALLTHNRPWTSIDVLATAVRRNPESADGSQVALVVATLDLALQGAGEGPRASISADYGLAQLLDFLERMKIDRDVMVRFEWGFFGLLQYIREPRALNSALGDDPQLFVDLVCRVYRTRGSEPRSDPDEHTVALARHSWLALDRWFRRPGLPGLDDSGRIDDQHLRSWVRRARALLAENDRAEIGDQQIGQVLAGSPTGKDDVWPAEEVRELLEDLGSRRVETGLIIGLENRRGVTSRGLFDGGVQEWILADNHRKGASLVVDQWPRTGRVLNQIADDYERQARREDAEAQAQALSH